MANSNTISTSSRAHNAFSFFSHHHRPRKSDSRCVSMRKFLSKFIFGGQHEYEFDNANRRGVVIRLPDVMKYSNTHIHLANIFVLKCPSFKSIRTKHFNIK